MMNLTEQEISEALEGLILKGLVETAGVTPDGEITYAIVGAQSGFCRTMKEMLSDDDELT